MKLHSSFSQHLKCRLGRLCLVSGGYYPKRSAVTVSRCVAWCLGVGLVCVGLACGTMVAADSTDSLTASIPSKDEHSLKHHHLGVFMGYAVKDTDKRKEGFKIGLEYEYQFHKLFGVRGFGDYEAGNLDTWLAGAGLSFHTPKVPLVVFAGGAAEIDGSKKGAFFRLSGEYKFKVTKKVFVAPVMGYDFGRKDKSAFFVGGMFGTGF